MDIKSICHNFIKKNFGYQINRVTNDPAQGKSYRESLIDFIENYQDQIKGNVLDLGTGTWTWPQERFGEQCTITTFDQFAHDHIDIVGDLHKLSDFVKKDYYDVVFCLDVIEHLENPFIAIAQIYQVLKKAGVLLASTPFAKNLHGEEYGDYWRITRQGWRLLLKDFRVIQVEWIGAEPYPRAYFLYALK